jgi:hypothetical protein
MKVWLPEYVENYDPEKRRLWIKKRNLIPVIAGGAINRRYTVNSGLIACPAATVTKVPIQIATPATGTVTIIGLDITFDSVATGAGAVPVRVELVRYTAVGSGGTAPVAAPWKKSQIASTTTARINDTTEGAGPSVIMGWLVSPTAGILQQLPLGRDVELEASDFVGMRIIPQTGFTACNYNANLHLEE